MRAQEKETARSILKSLDIEIDNFQLISNRNFIATYFASSNNCFNSIVTLNCMDEDSTGTPYFYVDFGSISKIGNKIEIKPNVNHHFNKIFEDVNSKLDIFEGIVVVYHDRSSNKQKESSIIDFLTFELSIRINMDDNLDSIYFCLKANLTIPVGCYVKNIYLSSTIELPYFKSFYFMYKNFELINSDYPDIKKCFYNANELNDLSVVNFKDIATLTMINIYN